MIARAAATATCAVACDPLDSLMPSRSGWTPRNVPSSCRAAIPTNAGRAGFLILVAPRSALGNPRQNVRTIRSLHAPRARSSHPGPVLKTDSRLEADGYLTKPCEIGPLLASVNATRAARRRGRKASLAMRRRSSVGASMPSRPRRQTEKPGALGIAAFIVTPRAPRVRARPRPRCRIAASARRDRRSISRVVACGPPTRRARGARGCPWARPCGWP